MRAAGKSLTVLVTTILTLGLMYSQVCNTVCVFAACSDQAKVKQPVQNKEVGHCHQHKSPSGDSQPEPPQPNGSHDCKTHNAINSLLPVTIAGADWLHQSSQPDVIAPFVFAVLTLEHLAGSSADITPFRAPPKRPQRSILRI
jgi:hypothetical protein